MGRRLQISVTWLASLTVLTAACDTSSSVATLRPAPGGVVTIANASGSLWTCGFNPYNASDTGESFGLIYEPLVYDNLLNDKRTPWLARAYRWSPDSRAITFTIRSGVRWSDGEPFSAADVVYTFNLLKQYPALDLQSVWSVLTGVSQQGDEVYMTLISAAVPYFYQIAGQTPIVPQHIWMNIKDPVTESMPNPVGTGPLVTDATSCRPHNITYSRNPDYWQPGLPHIQTVLYPAFTDNDAANQYLASGQAQWGGQFIPNIESNYVATDRANHHYWFPPIQNVNLWFNVTRPLLDNKLVRQAFAFGIDRGSVALKGEYGYAPAGNQTGILTPTFTGWLDTASAVRYNYKFDPVKATSLLQKAGFTQNSSGIFQDSSGAKLSFSVITIGGYSDWAASLQVMQDHLRQVGIEITVQNLSSSDFATNLSTGDFQLAYGALATSVGPSPYYELRNVLDSRRSADIGQIALGDYGRYNNQAVNGLFDQFGLTRDPAQQHRLIDQVQAAMLEDVPVIPVTESVAWYEYSTNVLAGWPTEANQFAAPAPWNLPDMEVTLLHLYRQG